MGCHGEDNSLLAATFLISIVPITNYVLSLTARSISPWRVTHMITTEPNTLIHAELMYYDLRIMKYGTTWKVYLTLLYKK